MIYKRFFFQVCYPKYYIFTTKRDYLDVKTANPFNNLLQKIYRIMASYKQVRDSSASPPKEQAGDDKMHSLRKNFLEVYIEIRAVLCPGQLDAVSYISASGPIHHFQIDYYI